LSACSIRDPEGSHTPLEPQTNPFRADSNAPPVRSAAAALEELVRLIGLRARAIIITGGAGTGKTFLLRMVARSCSDKGLSVCHIDRGDLADPAIDARRHVVLVDDADTVPDSAILTLLFSPSSDTTTIWVFACLPSSLDRFRCLDAQLVELPELSIDDAQACLLERAAGMGRPDLFAPDALDLIVHQARGSPGALLSIASLAFFTAAWGGATQIGVRHAAYWSTSQILFDSAEDSAASPGRDLYRPALAVVPDGRTPIALLRKGFPRARAPRSNGGRAALAASIGLAGVVAAFLVFGNDANTGTRVAAPVANKEVAADVSVVQTPAMPVSPDVAASAERNAASSASVNVPAAKATAALDNRAAGSAEQPRVTAKRTRAPSPVTAARSARTPKSGGPPAPRETDAPRTHDPAYLARHVEDLARQVTEAALEARHAARLANDAARRADRAAHRAGQAAMLAERAARQANWGMRIQFPWKASRAPKRG
jgi:hypothetical protein